MSNEAEQIFLPEPAAGNERPAMLQRPGNAAAAAPAINLENVEDFTKVCRVCAIITEMVMPIYSDEGLRNNLADKINKHLPITVSENDTLPLVVCYQCTGTLLATHELAQCSLQADAALRTRAAQRFRTMQERQEELRAAARREQQKARQNAGNSRRCEYCPELVAGGQYRAHLLAQHGKLLFHCEECDGYIPRPQFLVHMATHAAQYQAAALLPRPAPAAPATPAAADSTTRAAPDDVIEVSSATSEDTAARDADFSDHDAEPFDPLPQAVLNAIEESRDRPTEESSPAAEAPAPEAPAPEASAPAAPTPESPKARPVRQCPHCPKSYTAASSYFYHLKYVHGNSKEHPCPTCGRRFGTRGALREHAGLHSPTAALECDLCGKRFRSKAGRYIHRRTHEPAERFPCARCGRAFRWRAALERHLARHEARRQHECGACGAAFNVRADLLRHARTHRRAAHRCPHAACRATFAQPRYLRAHVARKHPDQRPVTRNSA